MRGLGPRQPLSVVTTPRDEHHSCISCGEDLCVSLRNLGYQEQNLTKMHKADWISPYFNPRLARLCMPCYEDGEREP